MIEANASQFDADQQRYEALFEEAKRITGVSLSQDAWRRLKRNRVAMISLGTLVAISLLAFFTPFLPLAPPDLTLTELQYASPSFQPLVVKGQLGLQLDRELVTAQRDRIETAKQELREAESALRQLESEQTASTAEQTEGNEAAWEAARQSVRQKNIQISDIIQKPYRDAGFPDLNIIDRAMVRARYAIFGEASLGPIGGRDELGRDVFSRLFWGARISLTVGLVATLVSLIIGVSYGAISGYLGGWVDDAMMRAVDVLYSIPFIFVVIFILTILSEDSIKTQLQYWGIEKIHIFFVVVGAIYWLTMARVVRGQVISLKNEQFIEAARTIGAGRPRIIFLHLVPNLLSIVIVYLTLTIPRVILFEAFLSFLGLGVEAPQVSWGMMANKGIEVITPIKIYWWLVVWPSLALGVTLFALNFLGDGLRDALDPRMKNR